MKIFGVITGVVFAISGWAQSLDYTHLSVALKFEVMEQKVMGEVGLTFKMKNPNEADKLDSIFLNGIRMEYQLVQFNGQLARFGSNDKGIWIFPDKGTVKAENRINIDYTCTPRKGLFFTGWNDEQNKAKKQIWTQGQGIDHRHWVPHNDDQTDKLITEMIISFDKKYEVISNGELFRKYINGYNQDQMTWHYRMEKPHSSYLMMLAVGDYEWKKTKSTSQINLSQYYYPERGRYYDWYYRSNEEIFNFLETEIGVPYPWGNDYKQVPVMDFQHGAMENTGATIFGDFFLVDEAAFADRNYTYVNAHELAHQWFGNLVTATGSEHHWLHEGFATYYQWLSEGNLYGKDFLDWERYKAAQLVFDSSKRDSIPLGNGKAGSNRFYQKGAWVVHQLQQQLSEEEFKKSMQHYLNKHAHGLVTTDSLRIAIQEVTGKDFSDFFAQWVQVGVEPTLKVLELEHTKKSLKLYVQQSDNMNHNFSFEAKVLLGFTKGEPELRVVNFKKSNDTLHLDLPKGRKLAYWNFDDGKNLLAHIEQIKSIEMWQAQFERSVGVLDRYEALQNLKSEELAEKKESLETAFNNSKEFYSVRALALLQLLKQDAENANYWMLQALKSGDVALQKEAVKMLDKPTKEHYEALFDLFNAKSYELRIGVFQKLLAIENTDVKELLLNKEIYANPGFPGNEMRVLVLLYRLAYLKDVEALNALKNYTSVSYDFMTRNNAMDALMALDYFDKDMAVHYFDALFNLNRKLSNKAAARLKHYYKVPERQKWLDDYIGENKESWNEFDKRKVNRTFNLSLN